MAPQEKVDAHSPNTFFMHLFKAPPGRHPTGVDHSVMCEDAFAPYACMKDQAYHRESGSVPGPNTKEIRARDVRLLLTLMGNAVALIQITSLDNH